MIQYKYTSKGSRRVRAAMSAVPSEFHLALFREMLRIPLVEEEIERPDSEDQMKLDPPGHRSGSHVGRPYDVALQGCVGRL